MEGGDGVSPSSFLGSLAITSLHRTCVLLNMKMHVQVNTHVSEDAFLLQDTANTWKI